MCSEANSNGYDNPPLRSPKDDPCNLSTLPEQGLSQCPLTYS
ncbi:MAG: hypothetical protein SFY66_01040 [Oculatellaceae cyanobacterium bins.114]|nr:hypothetical protein [Oculatellaceae cyanobacterium bins.114]